jgi:hypothetical protein
LFRDLDFASFWDKAPELLIWMLFMFAIAAVGKPERAWAVAILDRCSRRMRIYNWDSMQALLSEFLWLPITNDFDGMEVWDEIEQSNPFGSVSDTIDDPTTPPKT